MEPARVLEKLLENAAPCLRLSPDGTGNSWIGGRPGLPDDFVWPRWRGKPLAFLAQIDLVEARSAGGPDWLPERGLLTFFYDAEQSTWGFSPEDAGSWVVMHTLDRAPSTLAPPPSEDVIEYGQRKVAMVLDRSLPTAERVGVKPFELSEQEWEQLIAAIEKMEPPLYARHQMGGWPYPIQNDSMEYEAQLASNGIDCGEPDNYRSAAAAALAPGASEWKLLFQLDSDEDLEMMWGDSGLLYFWIREADARAGIFSNVWMILQCC
jgi:uncharacterized protein YwqG